MKRKLNTFISHRVLKFGDYLLFQEYMHKYGDDNKDSYYEVTKPILAIYLGVFVADQAIGFDYVKWNNDNHIIKHKVITGGKEYEIKSTSQAQTGSHIEWDDYIDILDSWKYRPSWREILEAYRKQNVQQTVSSDDINWSCND